MVIVFVVGERIHKRTHERNDGQRADGRARKKTTLFGKPHNAVFELAS